MPEARRLLFREERSILRGTKLKVLHRLKRICERHYLAACG
jgi:hypothetical protein